MQFITSTENDIKLISLQVDDETLFSVAPEYGAKLKNLKLKKGDRLHELLWPVSTDDLKTNNWYKSAILFPYPNRLEDGKYTFENKSYQFPVNEPDKNNQLHGMLYDEPFTVSEQTIEGNTASLELSYVYEGEREYYPFPFIFSIRYTYGPAGFTVDFLVSNTGRTNLPFGLGWHPYFQIDANSIDTYTIQTPDMEMVALSERSIPTGVSSPYKQNPISLNETILDNAFRISGSENVYELNDSASDVTVIFTASEAFNYLQIFTPNKETVAIEPMTCNVNAFNNGEGVKLLEPKELFKAKFQMAIA